MENNKKSESNQQYSKGDKGFQRVMFILLLCPMLVYLSLIIIVVAWPDVMNALGLQAFVHWVTYDLQPDARLSILRAFPPCPPGSEVWFFYMQAASMLIVGPLMIVVSIVVMSLARAFPDKFTGRFTEMLRFRACASVMGFFFLFLYLVYDLFEGPSRGFSYLGCGHELYAHIIAWMFAYWLCLILVGIVCAYFITIRRNVFRK